MAVAQEHWAAKWIKYNGRLPNDAFYVDHYAIGRGQYEGGVHIGYVDQHHNRLIIGWGWKQHELHDFEVLCGDYNQFKWHHCQGACRPQFFIPLKSGHESDGKELYIAKTHYDNQWRIGKAGQHLIDGMSFAANGQEIVQPNYEVLGFLN